MAALELYLTIMVAWTSTGVTKDSVGIKIYFNKKEYAKCTLIRNASVGNVKESFKRNIIYNMCISKIKKLDEEECLFEAYDFAKKHKFKRKKCILMPLEKYNKHYTAKKAEFWIGPEWPIVFVCPVRGRCKEIEIKK